MKETLFGLRPAARMGLAVAPAARPGSGLWCRISLGEGVIPKGNVLDKELGRSRSFHDHEPTFEGVDHAGWRATHRYFLTGGIDYLLHGRSDTRVFHAVTKK